MKIFLLIIITFIISSNSFSQEYYKYSLAYEYYFLNNSNHNLENSDVDYLNNFKIKSNHNILFNYYIDRPKVTHLIGLTFQNYYGETNTKQVSVLISFGNFKYYSLIVTRRMNAFGLVYGIEKKLNNTYMDLYGTIGWSFINKNYIYTPSSYPLSSEYVLSHSPFFSINFSIKQRLFKTNKTATFLKFLVNERFIEFSSNFTLGLGLEINFLK